MLQIYNKTLLQSFNSSLSLDISLIDSSIEETETLFQATSLTLRPLEDQTRPPAGQMLHAEVKSYYIILCINMGY